MWANGRNWVRRVFDQCLITFTSCQVHALIDLDLDGNVKVLHAQGLDGIAAHVGTFDTGRVDHFEHLTTRRLDLGHIVAWRRVELQLAEEWHTDLGKGEAAVDQSSREVECFILWVLVIAIVVVVSTKLGRKICLSLSSTSDDGSTGSIESKDALDTKVGTVMNGRRQPVVQEDVLGVGSKEEGDPLAAPFDAKIRQAEYGCEACHRMRAEGAQKVIRQRRC